MRDHGDPLVDDPKRLAGVTALGLDETSFLKATRVAPTRFVTGLVDLERGRLLDLVADRTRRAVDHFHAIRLANAVVDQVRRRTQQATLGHRGRTHDPLYRIRKLLLTAAEQLTGRGWARLRAGLAAGDPSGEESSRMTWCS